MLKPHPLPRSLPRSVCGFALLASPTLALAQPADTAGDLGGMFSRGEFHGALRSPREGKEFWQNRLALQYAF